MTPERWQKIKQVLGQVLEASPEERAGLIAELCHDDPSLAAEVTSMLEFEHDESLEVQPVVPAGSFGDQLVGSIIGNYRIVRELGAGGMGEVYLAERIDGHFEQKAALKLIKTGFNTASIVARFRSERQILASLDHPNIARLVDGGTTQDGLPYLVMEYVDGEPLDKYVEKHQLGLAERLDLFREICSAVSYAHQGLVIHRDLKPSNILVNAEGVPKLLDFGIAKLLNDPAGGETRTGQFAFSTEYASPEQLRGENLTTSTDVYSLGIILYELLSGVRPFAFEGKSFGQIIETSTRATPTRPSSRRRPGSPLPINSLKGDLDTIALKALNKEPERRYSSVEQLSEDIRRYLQGHPVRARRDTWFYRAQKFSRRNQLFVASAALTMLILVSGIGIALYLKHNADLQRERAESRFNEVRALANSFVFEIDDKITSSPIKARQLLVERAITYLDSLSRESSSDADLQGELAAAYAKVGDIQAALFNPNLGDAGAAAVSYRKSMELLEDLTARVPENREYQAALARSYQRVGNIQTVTGDMPGAAYHYQRSVDVLTRLSQLAPDDPDVKKQLSTAYSMLGQATLRTGSLIDCLAYYNKALSLMDDLTTRDPDNAEYLVRRSTILNYIGYPSLLMGRFDAAINNFDQSLSISQRIYEKAPDDINAFRNFNSAVLWKGIGLREAGRAEESVKYFEQSLAVEKRLYDGDKENMGELNSLADCYLELGTAESRTGRTQVSLDHMAKAVEGYREVMRRDPANVSARQQVALTQIFWAEKLSKMKRHAEAARLFSEAFDTCNNLMEKDASNLEYQHRAALSQLGRGKSRLALGDKASAQSDLSEAAVLFERLAQRSPENIVYQAGRSEVAALLSSNDMRAAK